MSMSRKRFKWTPEAVERLRRLDGTMRDCDIAAQLGCTYWALVSKKQMLRLLDERLDEMEPAQRYARRYMVSRSIVDFLGLDVLDAMDEETRRHALWNLSKRLAKPRSESETTERIERMMYLSGKVA